MADYKEMLSRVADRAKELAGSESVGRVVDRLREAASGGGVKEIYTQGADRARLYGRVARLTLERNRDNTELGRVYAEIGRLYFEQHQGQPEGAFAPLFAQAAALTEQLHAKEDEIEALRAEAGSTGGEPDIEVEIADFESVVDATEADGTGAPPKDTP